MTFVEFVTVLRKLEVVEVGRGRSGGSSIGKVPIPPHRDKEDAGEISPAPRLHLFRPHAPWPAGDGVLDVIVRKKEDYGGCGGAIVTC